MRVSALEAYGLRCLVALARGGTSGQMSISEVADAEGLSIPYTAKVLSILRQAGFVTAVRGRGGGFCIARHPGEVTLLEVITALGGRLITPDHCSRFTGQLDRCIHRDNCSIYNMLDGLAGHLDSLLSSTTLQDLTVSKRRVPGNVRSTPHLTTTSAGSKIKWQRRKHRQADAADRKQ